MRKDNPKHTAAYKIFHYNFEVTIPSMYLYSERYLDVFGMETSGDTSIDEGYATAPTRAYLTIAAMATYHNEGADIGLINPEDSLRIYNYVNEHLTEWNKTMRFDVNRREAPTDDLRALDAFAKAIYPTARHYMTAEPVASSLFAALDNIGTRPMSKDLQKPIAEVKSSLAEEHTSVVDELIVEHARRNRRTLFSKKS